MSLSKKMTYISLTSETTSMFFRKKKKQEQAKQEAQIRAIKKETIEAIREATITTQCVNELYKKGGMTELVWVALGSNRKKK